MTPDIWATYDKSMLLNAEKIPEHLQKEFVKQDRTNIKYIKNPSRQLQRQHFDNYYFRKDRINVDPDIQLEYVGKNPMALLEIKNPTEMAIEIAIKKDPYSIRGVENPDPTHVKMAIKKNPDVFNKLRNGRQPIEIQKVALDHYDSMKYGSTSYKYDRWLLRSYAPICNYDDEFVRSAYERTRIDSTFIWGLGYAFKGKRYGLTPFAAAVGLSAVNNVYKFSKYEITKDHLCEEEALKQVTSAGAAWVCNLIPSPTKWIYMAAASITPHYLKSSDETLYEKW